MIKICSRCSLEKEDTEFHWTKKPVQRSPYCKKCDNARKTKQLRKKSLDSGKTQKTLTLVAKELRLKGLKFCPMCKETKNLSSFYTSGLSNRGYASHCIICANQIGKNRHKLLPEEKKDYYKRNKRTTRNAILKREFGITIEDYEALFKSQNGLCAICGELETRKALAVDHNHKTKIIRGLLCGRCNPAVGYLKDDPNLARKLAEYLEKTDVLP